MAPNQLPDNGESPVLSDRLSAIVESVSRDSNHSCDLSDGVRTSRTSMVLALILSVIPMSAMAKSETSTQNSIDLNMSTLVFKHSNTLTWQKINRMSWDEMKEKLKEMTWEEIQEALNLLSKVSTDAREMGKSEIADKLTKNNPLNEPEKAFFLAMARKYGINDLTTLEGVLNKEQLTNTELQYSLIKFKEILRKQRDVAKRYANVRGWLNTTLALSSNVFESPEDFTAWSEDNVERMRAFVDLSRSLEQYAESLDK
jgi:hypothetical protein